MALELHTTSPSFTGPLRFIRYAFMPNHLRYCGGDENRTLLEYGVEGVVDGGLTPMLVKFNGALPYLQLIARVNNIQNPFDERVVEAYWIGSPLLDNVEVRDLYEHLAERFKKKLQGSTRKWVLSKAPAGARPHHNFHVFDVHSRVGELENTLHTIDQCRISWGKVVEVDGAELVVERQPLVIQDGKLTLAPATRERVPRQIEGKGFADDASVGDWVTVHWSWVCETISDAQQRQLQRWTDYHLVLANQTL